MLLLVLPYTTSDRLLPLGTLVLLPNSHVCTEAAAFSFLRAEAPRERFQRAAAPRPVCVYVCMCVGAGAGVCVGQCMCLYVYMCVCIKSVRAYVTKSVYVRKSVSV